MCIIRFVQSWVATAILSVRFFLDDDFKLIFALELKEPVEDCFVRRASIRQSKSAVSKYNL